MGFLTVRLKKISKKSVDTLSRSELKPTLHPQNYEEKSTK